MYGGDNKVKKCKVTVGYIMFTKSYIWSWQKVRVVKNNVRNKRNVVLVFYCYLDKLPYTYHFVFKTKLICHFTEASVDQMSG